MSALNRGGWRPEMTAADAAAPQPPSPATAR